MSDLPAVAQRTTHGKGELAGGSASTRIDPASVTSAGVVFDLVSA